MGELDANDVKILEKKLLYKKFFEVNEYTLRHPVYKGGLTPPFCREVMDRGHAAGILLYDPDADKLVFVRQFRIGVYLNGDDPWTIECVAGMIDHENEKAEDVVVREAWEEAGAVVEDVEEIMYYYPSPGGCTETIRLFCGRTDASKLPQYAGLESETEDIKVLAVPFDEAVKMMENGKIYNALTLLAIQWMALNRTRLIDKWGKKR